MATFLFLGFCILSYFIIEKFLRRFYKLSVYHLTYGDVYESYSSPAFDISAGCGESWEFPDNSFNYSPSISSYSTSNSSKAVEDLIQIRNKSSLSATESSILLANYLQKYGTREEQELKRKERLYNANLRNKLCLNNRPKIRKRPKVRYLPTIFESLPYPITAESLIKQPEEKSDLKQTIENEAVTEPVISESNISNKKKKYKSNLRKVKNFFKKFSSFQKLQKLAKKKFHPIPKFTSSIN